MIKDEVFNLHGAWRVSIDGEVLPTTWNSKGAAEAGLEVERQRRFKKITVVHMHPEGCVCCGGSCSCVDGTASNGESCEMCWSCNLRGCDEMGPDPKCPGFSKPEDREGP